MFFNSPIDELLTSLDHLLPLDSYHPASSFVTSAADCNLIYSTVYDLILKTRYTVAINYLNGINQHNFTIHLSVLIKRLILSIYNDIDGRSITIFASSYSRWFSSEPTRLIEEKKTCSDCDYAIV